MMAMINQDLIYVNHDDPDNLRSVLNNVANNTSAHILNTSATLLGFCLFVITSLHISNYSATSIMDELTSVAALALIFSCLFSFFAIRTSDPVKEKKLENVADYLFVTALLGILVILLLIALNYIK
jgi:hypothetical protein